MYKDCLLTAPSVCTSRRQEELEARLVEEETTKRVEELVAKRVQEELERRKDEIEREVLRRVEEAKKVGGAKPEGGFPWSAKMLSLGLPSSYVAVAGYIAGSRAVYVMPRSGAVHVD